MKRVSVTVVVAALLVAVTTLVLGGLGAFAYTSRRNEQLLRLRRVTQGQTEELATALALPVWNIDRPQIDKVLDSQAMNPPIEGVVVHAAGHVHARIRDAHRNFVPSDDGVLNATGLIVAERPIVFGTEVIGNVKLYMTPRLIEAELRRSLLQTAIAILLVDVLLVLSIYLVLWRVVLRPLVSIERYAVAVSAGVDAPTAKPATTTELEQLRLSIETIVQLLDGREKAIKQEKDFTETALNVMREFFWVQDRNARFIRWNQKFVDQFGPEPLQRTDRYILNHLVHPDDRALMFESGQRVFEGGTEEIEVRYFDGDQLRYMDLGARRMVVDGEPYLVATGMDVTDKKVAETEQARLRQVIAQSAIEWRQTFDSVETPIVIVSADGTILRLNEPAMDLIRRANDQLPSNLSDLKSSPWTVASELRGGIAHDDRGHSWDVRVTRLFSDADDRSLIIVFFDITRIVALQESLRRSETTTAMGKLVGGVAHEVRNPLFGISATLDAYGDEMNTPELREMSATLKEQVGRLSRLMRELLEFGKPVAVTRHAAALEPLIEEVIASRRREGREKEVDVRNLIEESVPRFPMDRDRLIQVFENLVDNALQHAPRSSAIAIIGRPVLHAGRNWVEIRVEDQGPGFPGGELEQVFEPFFTRREHGTGLGLSIVRKIIEEHEGSVTAENRQEGGARVTIRLPV